MSNLYYNNKKVNTLKKCILNLNMLNTQLKTNNVYFVPYQITKSNKNVVIYIL